MPIASTYLAIAARHLYINANTFASRSQLLIVTDDQYDLFQYRFTNLFL